MESRPHGIDLSQYVDAVAVLIHHPDQPAHLTLDLPEPGRDGRLRSSGQERLGCRIDRLMTVEHRHP
jgi:hypothetical protein